MKKLFFAAIAACLTIIPVMAEDMQYGRNVSDFASTPKFGGYVIGKYA